MVHSYSYVPSHVSTLAPPGEYNIELVHHSAHSSPQPKRKVDRFSHFCTGRKSPYITMGNPFPQNCPFSLGSEPHLIHDSLGPSERNNQMASRLVRTCDRRVSLYFAMGHPFPLKITASHGDLDPYLIHGSLGPPKSSTQMASRSVQPFCRAH